MKGEETTYDGDGRPVKVDSLINDKIGGNWTGWVSIPMYYIYSSVTGQKVTDIAYDGTFMQTHVNMGGTVIAEQLDGDVNFKVTDPVSGSSQNIDSSGEIFTNEDERTDGGRSMPGSGDIDSGPV